MRTEEEIKFQNGINVGERARLGILGMQSRANRLKGLFGSAVIEYWPFANDANGAINGRNGVASNVTFDGISASFNGTTSYIDLIAASGLIAAWNGQEGTLYRMIKVSAVGVWSDGALRYISNFNSDGNNYNTSYRQAAGNNNIVVDYKAGGTQEYLPITVGPGTGWIGWGQTWSKSGDLVQPYIDGVPSGSGSATLGTYTGAIGTALVGAGTTTPSGVWSGFQARMLLLSRAANSTEMAAIHNIIRMA